MSSKEPSTLSEYYTHVQEQAELHKNEEIPSIQKIVCLSKLQQK